MDGNPLGTTKPSGPESLSAMRLARGVSASGPRISLLIYHPDHTQVLTLTPGRTYVIGRDPSAEVPIADESLSRRHARFEVVSGEVWVDDLGSTNGTKLNGQRVSRARLGVGDELSLGAVTASIHVLPPLDTRLCGLDGHDRFVVDLQSEVVRARIFGRSAALLMLQLRGQQAGPCMTAFRACLRPVDRIASYSEDTVEVLLPEAGEEQAMRVLQALAAAVPGARILGALALYPSAGTSAERLLAACCESLRSASAARPLQRAVEAPSAIAERGIVFRSEAMRQIVETIDRLATAAIPVLLYGETGTGKEVLARLIHDQGPRRDRRLASINCGAIPATLVESVLFGHERGAFTGALQAARGVLEEADGGTVLLDEVAELSASAQAALLRALETKRITRVGSTREIAVDVRIIAATNRDLEAMCVEGLFRSDLLYRLNAMTLEIPPLRERPEEIGPLAERFLEQANELNQRQVKGIDAETMRLLHQYPWPGNVRELRNAIERAVVIARGDRLAVEDLPRRVRELAAQTLQSSLDSESMSDEPATDAGVSAAGSEAGTAADYRTQLQRYEVQIILEALRRAGWNRSEAARRLQIPVRTLSHKIRALGIKKLGFAVDDS